VNVADEFNIFLREALAPAARDEDHLFVGRVQGAVRLDDQLRAERSNIVRTLLLQLLALAGVAAAVLWVGRAPAVAAIAESPWLLELLLTGLFGLVVALLAGRDGMVTPSSNHFSNLTD
jgi:hypothetical protein